MLPLYLLLMAAAVTDATGHQPLTPDSPIIRVDGALFDLGELVGAVLEAPLASPRGAKFTLRLGGALPCNNPGDTSCIHVPTLPPASCGLHVTAVARLLQPGAPGAGLELRYSGGAHCAVVARGRETVVRLHCDHLRGRRAADVGFEAREGIGRDVCTYFLDVRTAFACPRHTGGGVAEQALLPPPPLVPPSPPPPPQAAPAGAPLTLLGVTGCVDVTETFTTTRCPRGTPTVLTVHGGGFVAGAAFSVMLQPGDIPCRHAAYASPRSITCTLGPVGTAPSAAAGLPPPLSLHVTMHATGGGTRPAEAALPGAVAFRQPPLPFDPRTFAAHGVGGLDRQVRPALRISPGLGGSWARCFVFGVLFRLPRFSGAPSSRACWMRSC